MFLRVKTRFKDGKEHRYWSIVESRRTSGGRVVQRHGLYLGEINDSQKAAWCKTIQVFDGGGERPAPIALFPDDRVAPPLNGEVVPIRLNEWQRRHPRQWGACWLAGHLWEQLPLDAFWADKLPPSRQGTRWLKVFKTLVCYRLIDPGSEWRWHRYWYEQSAMADWLGEDFGLVQIDKLYRCLDKRLRHKKGLFSFLRERWQALFDVRFEGLWYDLTSTYFECDVPETGQRKFGYRRDQRSDGVPVVIALMVTPEGFPLAYEVMPGNTCDKTTLADFMRKIEAQYGKAQRTGVMDRGIPTEETLAQMRAAETPIYDLVGTPKGRLSQLEKAFLKLPWAAVRDAVEVKLLDQGGELYVLVRSSGRADKARSMRRRRLKKRLKRLHELQAQTLPRDQLLIKLGAAKKEAGRAYGLVDIQWPDNGQDVTPETFRFTLNRRQLRTARRREGSYLLRSNLTGNDPGQLWEYYVQLTEVEQAFKELKGDLSIRPIDHPLDDRIEAPILVAFMAYCLHITLKHRLRALAPGLTPRAVLEKMAALQMVDVYLPTTDGRHLILSRYTQPEKDQQLLLSQMKLKLPPQPPPKITASATAIP